MLEKSHKIAELMLLNPVAQAIQDARHFAISPKIPTLHVISDNAWFIAIPYVLSVVTLIVGALYFRRRAPYFAEDI